MAGAPMDMELRRAFEDLQAQVVTTRDKVRQFQAEIDTVTRAASGMRITNRTLEQLGPQHRTYEAVGRAFVLRERPKLMSHISKMVTENEGRAKTLEEYKQKAKSRQAESEAHLRELLTKKHYKA